MSFLPQRLLLATVIASIFATPAGSQTIAAPAPVKAVAPVAAPVQKVEITGNKDQYDPRRDDTASKIVVTQEEIVKNGDTSLADVLKRQPGVTVSGGNAGRGGGEIRMRGLGAGYTQILLNGEAAPPGFTLDNLSPNQVERIEIMRSASAEFSTQAIAGTVNMVLKSKVVPGQRELKLTLEGSNIFLSPIVNYQVSDKVGKLAYTLSSNLRLVKFKADQTVADDSFDAAGQQTLKRRADQSQEGRFANLSLSPRLIWSLDNGDTLTSQTFVNATGVRVEAATDWAQSGPSGIANRASERMQSIGSNPATMLRTDLQWVHKTAGGGKLDTKLGVNASRRQSGNAQQAYNDDTQFMDRRTETEAKDRGVTLVGKFSTSVVKDHTFATGWDAGSGTRDETRAQSELLPTGYQPSNPNGSFSATINRLAVFAQDEWNVTPKWSVYMGARWETLQTKSEGSDFNPSSSRYSVFSPLFQTLWKLPNSNNDQIRMALTRTYRAPGINRLIPRGDTAVNNSQIEPDSRGNPALKPELATGLDLSYEHFFGAGALVSASFYAKQIKDVTRTDVVFVDGRWVSMPVNDGHANTHGVELEAKFPLRQFFKTGPAIDLRANLSRNWSSVDNVPGPDNRIANQTPMSANFGLEYKMNPAFNMGGSFTYKSGGPVRTSKTTSGYTTIKREMDLFGLWKFDAKNQLRVSAVNVLAQPFVSITRYDDDAYGSRINRVDTPFTAMVRVTFEKKL
ncbi:MAG: TonB-dependent receptor [Massilia sp.]